MVKISHFIEEPKLIINAQDLAKLITPEVIAKDQKLDIVFGVAGAIPGLLSLYQETQDKSIFDTAIICGNHLLSQQTGTYPKAWKTLAEAKDNGCNSFQVKFFNGVIEFSGDCFRL